MAIYSLVYLDKQKKTEALSPCRTALITSSHRVGNELDYYGLLCYDNRENRQREGNQSSSAASFTPLFTPILKSWWELA